jgi:hypothetical protein
MDTVAEEEKSHHSEGKKEASDDKAAPKETLVTEKPVASAPFKKTSQYVVTVDNSTGFIQKIERLDEETGSRKAFTKQELAATLAMSPYTAAISAYASASPASAAAAQAYYQGVLDYLKALQPYVG